MENTRINKLANQLVDNTQSTIDEMINYIEELEQDLESKTSKIQDLESEIETLQDKLNNHD